VKGFSTTINALPSNQPIWVRVAATDNCAVGVYSAGVGLPNTGVGPSSIFSQIIQIIRQWLSRSLDTSLKNTAVLGTQPIGHGLPIRIKIPKIHVDAAVQYLGLTPEGAMDVPSNSIDVGWFKLGTRPGDLGSAVIAGHFDSQNGSPGVFAQLHKLKPEDELIVVDDKGASISYKVRESRTYNPKDDVPGVFNQSDGMHLNLITCDGIWDNGQKSYSKRLVVFADAEP